MMMFGSSRRFVSLSLGLAATLGLGACFEAPVERPENKVTQETAVRVEQSIKDQVDLLFVIDDSPSMAPKQAELRARFPQLITILDEFANQGSPADYHIGVVTTDLGAGAYTGTNCKPNGLGGKLQKLGRKAPTGCVGPTDANYIKYNQKTGANNLPTGKNLSETFGCMAAVGDSGCGFEQTLEAAYKAIHDDIPENAGFFRDNALLVVVFVTDEDDCSADNNSDIFSAPVVQPPQGLGYRQSYRCTRYGVMHDGPNGPELMPYGDSGMPVTNPRPATANVGAKLIDVQKYIDFFTKPKSKGGAKTNPRDVVLVGITGPSSPVRSILANPNTALAYQQCSPPISEMCQPVLDRSCVNGQFFGDPAVRINWVINSLPTEDPPRKQVTSICDSSYQMALERLGNLIVSNIGPGCITSPFKDENGDGNISAAEANCVVADVVPDGLGGFSSQTLIPNCDEAGSARPCWSLNVEPRCNMVCETPGQKGQRFGIKIDRGGQTPPSGTEARVFCETIAVPKPENPQDATNPFGCVP
jgi:hypothetical protein